MIRYQSIINRFCSLLLLILILLYHSMGCCFSQPQVDEQITANISQVKINQEKPTQQINPEIANNHRDQGKKFFNSGNFEQATKSYTLALTHDPQNLVNYTNLALSQKALHKYQESISTINQMESKAKQDNINFSLLTKGKILKARCQSIIVKNYCINEGNASGSEFNKSLKLIDESVRSLKNLLQHPNYKQSAKAMNVEKYLENSLKIRQVCTSMKSKSDNSFELNYFEKRLKSKQSELYFKTMELSRYISQSKDILAQLRLLEKGKQKQKLKNDQEDEQFTIDPITYEIYKSPILVQSGLTYEESALKSHYEKNGSHDPITKQKFTDELGVVNRTLMAYIDQTKKTHRLNAIKQLDL